MKFAVLGVGEAGGAIASDLVAAEATVFAWDPAPREIPIGVKFMGSNPEAARQVDVVLSVNWDIVAIEVAEEVLPVLKPGQIYADMNTASPKTKQAVEKIISPSGIHFADVAIMAPILPRGIGTPTLASGPGALQFQSAMSPLGMPVTVVGDNAGSAAERKLLRSTFYKGLAAVVVETLDAARLLGLEEWILEQMLTILSDEQMIERFVTGSVRHAERRTREMAAVVDMLHGIGLTPYTSEASMRQLIDLHRSQQQQPAEVE